MDKIQQLQDEARYLDSAAFSLDALRARQKLAQFQLADTGLWLVKLVQAAVAWEADSISIRFQRNAVQASFQAGQLPEAGHLLNLVMSGDLPAEPGLLHLVTALRACSAGNAEAVEWSCGSSCVRLDGQSALTSPRATRGFEVVAHRPARQRSLSETLATPISHLVRNVAEEYAAVAQRCWVCPIPIQLDGRYLERGYNSPLQRGLIKDPTEVLMQYEKSRANIPTFCVGLRQIPPLPGRPGLRAIQSYSQQRKPVLKNQTWLHWENEGETIGAALSLQAYRNCPNQVDFVCHGAVVASYQFDWNLGKPGFLGWGGAKNLGLRLVFPVQADELDLSQFEVRDKAGLAVRLLQLARPQLVELLQRLLDETPNLYYLPFTARHGQAMGVGVGTYALGGSLILGAWFILPVGMLAGTVVGSAIMAQRKRTQTAIQELLKILASVGAPASPCRPPAESAG
ncbi:MAG: hypothetical protein U0931_27220 [Vulcanimicrobiota bacterium]